MRRTGRTTRRTHICPRDLADVEELVVAPGDDLMAGVVVVVVGEIAGEEASGEGGEGRGDVVVAELVHGPAGERDGGVGGDGEGPGTDELGGAAGQTGEGEDERGVVLVEGDVGGGEHAGEDGETTGRGSQHGWVVTRARKKHLSTMCYTASRYTNRPRSPALVSVRAGALGGVNTGELGDGRGTDRGRRTGWAGRGRGRGCGGRAGR